MLRLLAYVKVFDHSYFLFFHSTSTDNSLFFLSLLTALMFSGLFLLLPFLTLSLCLRLITQLLQSISTFLRALTPPQTTASPSLLSLDPEPLLQIIASAARQHLSSVWLSLAETLVGRLAPPLGFSDSFGPEAQRTQGLVREISGVLLRSGIDALREGEDKMSANPDLVEGLFKFASAVSPLSVS